MKMNCAVMLAFLLSGASALLGQEAAYPTATITVRAVDEDGNPVPGSKAGGAFEVPKRGGFGTESVALEGITDNEGKFISTGQTSSGIVSYGAGKDGYYRTANLRYLFKEKAGVQWQPPNPVVEVMLKRIVNPIPMFAKRVETKMPEDAAPVGFDLQAGDWVAPYGKGTVKDFIFTVNRTITSDRDYRATLVLRFSNEGDGLVPVRDPKSLGSELLLPRTAPEGDYEPERIWNCGRAPTDSGPDVFGRPSEVMAYFFRVRTVLDEKGRVKSALYGKMHGDILLYIGTKAPKAGLGFTCYLNPTPNDRNVEFDPNRNLFIGLKGLESVSAP